MIVNHNNETEISLRTCIPSDFEKVYQWLYFSDIPHFKQEIEAEYKSKIPSPDEFQIDYPSYFFDGTAPKKGRSHIILIKLKEEIGHISYTSFHLLSGICELDIWLSSSKYTQKGFGPLAIRLMIRQLFNMGSQKIIMRPSIKNTCAIRAYTKAGLKEIEPDLSAYYKAEYIDLYGPGDWGTGKDKFMVITKMNERDYRK